MDSSKDDKKQPIKSDASSSESATKGVSRFGLRVSQTPRIDISRASSSSQHGDSRDSSPENVFEQVGTGTLQESTDIMTGDVGFLEDSTNDLRSSTEELYFEENKDKIETQRSRVSPVQFKLDEQHQACLLQNIRKDSVSSEVAALLCISGRTSRISSVGSQGSAVSRLSAVSGISRSPSPHKMLLETSFCGPKPINIDVISTADAAELDAAVELEQVILARNHDVTKAIIAEGIVVDTSTPKHEPKPKVEIRKLPEKRTQIVTGVAKADKISSVTQVKRSALKKNNQTIVGVTSEGTQYIRIKLKPDHLYDDRGLSTNEQVIEDSESSKPPDSLILNAKKLPNKKVAPHFTQLVQEGLEKQSDDSLIQPIKPIEGTASNIGSRSPSPAVSVSRKSSFCSLFKSKDTTHSPNATEARKKSTTSILLDSPRNRSRSKSRESIKNGAPANSTPSKQRSVLAIFKPSSRRHSSKSPSPVDFENLTSNTEAATHKKADVQPATGRITPRLRYYDPPVDGAVVIPLHTPPDEKESQTFATQISTVATSSSSATTTTIPATAIKEPSSKSPKEFSKNEQAKIKITDVVPERTISTPVKSETPSKSATAKTQHTAHITKYADGSIRIPLHSPTEELVAVDNEDENSQRWSTAVQRNSSQESQDTVISSRAASLNSADATSNAKDNKNTIKQAVQEETIVSIENNVPVRTMTKEKKRILFSTKIGSGSEEQVFATQLSLSKTESLSSQLSEQPNLDSPTILQDSNFQKSDSINASQQPLAVKTKSKESSFEEERKKSSFDKTEDRAKELHKQANKEAARRKQDSISSDTLTPILTEKKTTELNDVVISKSIDESDKQSTQATGLETKATSSLEDQQGGSAEMSSGSDHDIDLNSKHRSPRQIGPVEEESTGLVSQESYEDELPFALSNLPEEKPVGISLIPVRERALMEIKTCPVERPRSTTPLNPSFLEEYCGASHLFECETDSGIQRGEKIRISLPKKDCKDGAAGQKTKSQRLATNVGGKNWFEFAEKDIGCAGILKSPQNEAATSSKGQHKSHAATTEWIDFDNIPEKRKPAKRITTLPQKSSMVTDHHVQYHYVNPEDCQCECHGNDRDDIEEFVEDPPKELVDKEQSPDDCVPLLESDPEDHARHSQVESQSDDEQIFVDRMSTENWENQSFEDLRSGTSAVRSTFDSRDSQSPIFSRSSKTTTVQLPQRLQR